MSTTAARRARTVVRQSQQVVAIELLTAASALEHRLAEGGRVALGRGTRCALQEVQQVLAQAGELPSDEIAALAEAVGEGRVVSAVESVIGSLPEVFP